MVSSSFVVDEGASSSSSLSVQSMTRMATCQGERTRASHSQQEREGAVGRDSSDDRRSTDRSSEKSKIDSYRISLDHGGLDAIMGTLYRDDGKSAPSARPFLPSSSSSVSHTPRRRRRATLCGVKSSSFHNLPSGKEPRRPSLDGILKATTISPGQHRAKKRFPRRRATIEGLPPPQLCLGRNLARTTPEPIEKHDERSPVEEKRESKRVSWSESHSISLVDLRQSPDAILALGRLQDEWAQKAQKSARAIPPPPLQKQKNGEWRGGESLKGKHQRRGISKSQSVKSSSQKSCQPQKRPIRVTSLPWTDHRGVQGEYTGEVNESIQPHGRGTFRACEGDGHHPQTVYSAATWKDGLLVSAQVPIDYKVKKLPTDAIESATSSGGPDPGPGKHSFKVKETTGSAGTSPLEDSRYPIVDDNAVPSRPAQGQRSNPGSLTRGESFGSAATKHPSRRSSAVERATSAAVQRSSEEDAAPTMQVPSCSNPNGDADDAIEASPTFSEKSIVSATTLPGYQLGQAARHRSHMIILPHNADPRLATRNANALKPLDFAFVLRSNGDWTYSIVADRPHTSEGPTIRFVLDGSGSTKTIRKKYWEKGIRPVNPDAVSELIERDDGDGNDGTLSGKCNIPTLPKVVGVDGSFISLQSDVATDGDRGGSVVGDETEASRKSARKMFKKLQHHRPASMVRSQRAHNASMNSARSDAAVIGKVVETTLKSVKVATVEEAPEIEEASSEEGGAFIRKEPMSAAERDIQTLQRMMERRGHSFLADESDRSDATLGSQLKAMMSLDYVGKFEDMEQPQQRGGGDRMSADYYGDLISNYEDLYSIDSGLNEESEKYHPKSKRSSGKSGGMLPGASFNGSMNSFFDSAHTLHRDSADHGEYASQKKRSLSKKHASFHSSCGEKGGANRRGSTGSMSLHPKRRSKRRGSGSSVCSVGSDVTNFSALLRDMYTGGSYHKYEADAQTRRNSGDASPSLRTVVNI